MSVNGLYVLTQLNRSYLRLTIVFNLGQLVCKMLHAPLEVGSLGLGVHVDLPHQQVGLIPQAGRLTDVGGEQLAHVPEVLLHIGKALLDLLGLVVPIEDDQHTDCTLGIPSFVRRERERERERKREQYSNKPR